MLERCPSRGVFQAEGHHFSTQHNITFTQNALIYRVNIIKPFEKGTFYRIKKKVILETGLEFEWN